MGSSANLAWTAVSGRFAARCLWSNYVLAMIFLALFPLFSRWRRNAFESQRWSESDFGNEGGSAGGDSDDD